MAAKDRWSITGGDHISRMDCNYEIVSVEIPCIIYKNMLVTRNQNHLNEAVQMGINTYVEKYEKLL